MTKIRAEEVRAGLRSEMKNNEEVSQLEDRWCKVLRSPKYNRHGAVRHSNVALRVTKGAARNR
jgi:hypothetical protein